MPKCAPWGAGEFEPLRGRIDSMLYERTTLSRKPEKLAKKELAILKSSGEVGPSDFWGPVGTLRKSTLWQISLENSKAVFKDRERIVREKLVQFFDDLGEAAWRVCASCRPSASR
jgi:hypothetical protein